MTGPADNADELQAGAAAFKARGGAPAAPKDALEGRIIPSTQNGTGAQTVFNIAHGLGAAPRFAAVVPGNAVSSALHFVTWSATNVIVTYAVAPAAATGNVILTALAIS